MRQAENKRDTLTPDALVQLLDLKLARSELLAELPCRLYLIPERVPADGEITLIWQAPPWPGDCATAIANSIALGWPMVLLAADDAALIRLREAVEAFGLRMSETAEAGGRLH